MVRRYTAVARLKNTLKIDCFYGPKKINKNLTCRYPGPAVVEMERPLVEEADNPSEHARSPFN